MRAGWLVGIVGIVGLAGFEHQAQAQAAQPSAEDVAAARALAVEGVTLADAGDCKTAMDKLGRAEAIYHTPFVLERLGECQISMGKLVAGTEALQRVVREQLPPNAPPAFVKAQQRAKDALPPALAKIGKVRIHVDAPSGASPKVTIDGAAISVATLDTDRPVDPGPHTIEASAPGCKAASTTIKVGEAASMPVSLKLEADPAAVAAVVPVATPGPTGSAPAPTDTPAAPPAPASPSPPPSPEAPPAAAAGSGHTLAYVALGVGVVGVAAGGVFGMSALGKKSTLDGACESKACPASAQSDIDAMNKAATFSTIGFGVGVVGLAAGTYLLLTGGSSSASAPKTGVVVRPWMGVTSAGMSGEF